MDTQDKVSQNKPSTQKRTQETRLNVGVGHKNPPFTPLNIEKTEEGRNKSTKDI
jgi:hypothetical protein